MNTKGNANRSVRNTKRKLRAVLIKLMAEKPIQSITVRELTEIADVNRGTFYFHYTDIYDLISEIENEFFEVFNEIIKAENVSNQKGLFILIDIFAFLAQNDKLCEVLLSPNGDIAFVSRIKEFVDEKCSEIWKSVGANKEDEYFDMFSSFIVNGCVGLFENWLKNGKKQTPEEMASLASQIIIPAVNAAFLGNAALPGKIS